MELFEDECILLQWHTAMPNGQIRHRDFDNGSSLEYTLPIDPTEFILRRQRDICAQSRASERGSLAP